MEQGIANAKVTEAAGLELQPDEINRQTGRIILPPEGGAVKVRHHAPMPHVGVAHGSALPSARPAEHQAVGKVSQEAVPLTDAKKMSVGTSLGGIALVVALLALCLAAVGWWRAGMAESRVETSELSLNAAAVSVQKWKGDVTALEAKVEALLTKVQTLEAEAQRSREALLEVKARQTTLENLGVLVETPETKP